MTMMGLFLLTAAIILKHASLAPWGDADYHTTSVSVLIAVYYHIIPVRKSDLVRFRGQRSCLKRNG